MAAKPLTKSQLISTLAEESGLSKKDVASLFDKLTELAYSHANVGFTLPGIGKISLRNSKAREMVMRFGPNAGKTVKVPAKKKLKFTYTKAAKDAILGE